MSTHPMTPLTDAEAVKLLRKAVQQSVACIQVGAHPDSERASVFRLLTEALAATAPPKPYRLVGNTLTHNIKCGSACVLRFEPDATYDERAAVLDALNALAEKEAAR